MTVKTKAALRTDINDNVNDNTSGDISAADVRNRLIDIVDSFDFELDGTVRTSAFTAVVAKEYDCNTVGGAFIVTTPASPSVDDEFKLNDYAKTFRTNNLELAQNAGVLIMGADESYFLDRAGATMKYTGATYGWMEI